MSELFIGKNARFTRKRCHRCRIPFPHCICNLIPSINSEINFWLVTHPTELLKPTNTGSLVSNSIPKSEKVIWDRVESNLKLTNMLEDPNSMPYILYPKGDSNSVSKIIELKKPNQKIQIMLLDGTWKQAGKMFRQSKYFQKISSISLDIKSSSEFIFRRQNKENHLSTVEAAVEILRSFGEREQSDRLKAYFKVFQYYYMQTKLNKKEIDVPSEVALL